MKVIVAGSRDFGEQERIFRVLDRLYKLDPEIEIVTGLARGPDTSGKLWAEANGVPIHEFPANWNKFGKSAGYKRNEEMAQFSDILLAFYDGTSRGTRHMVNLANEYGLKVRVFNPKL